MIKRRLLLKVISPVVFALIFATVLAGSIAERYLMSRTEEGAARTMNAEAAKVERVTEMLVLEKVRANMRVLQDMARSVGPPAQGGPVRVGDETAPDLLLGGTPQANDHALVDRVASVMGARPRSSSGAATTS